MNALLPASPIESQEGEGCLVRNARRIVDEVFDSVATWQEEFADAGMPARPPVSVV